MKLFFIIDPVFQNGIIFLLLIIGLWGEWPVGGICGPDLNMDGMITVDDLLLCIGDWGP